MNPKLNKALKITSSVIVGVVVLLTVLIYGSKLFGVEPYAVLSPSMEPKYPTGSLIYVADVEPADLKVNDVITFQLAGESTATHRIIELVPDENDPTVVRFRTKGDNNDTVDGSLVEADRVIGKPVFCIPLLGYFKMYIQTPPGNVIALTVGIALLLVVFILDTITDDKDKKKKSIENKNEIT